MIKVGIFFGGQSREREISFAGGRTVFDNLNKGIFTAAPIFVDSLGNFILLDWQFIYKGTIRDFYPPTEFYPTHNPHKFQLYIESISDLDTVKLNEVIQKIGKRIYPDEFSQYMDVAFLALHGPYGEDGNIQGLLEWQGIPYTGSGIIPSALCADKHAQKKWMQACGFDVPAYEWISRKSWVTSTTDDKKSLFTQLTDKLGLPLVVKSPNQGSSLGVSVVQSADFEAFDKAVQNSLFIHTLHKNEWLNYSETEKALAIADITDIKTGIGLPVLVKSPHTKGIGGAVLYSPIDLIHFIDEHFHYGHDLIIVESLYGEPGVLVEKYIKGVEFSCIVIQDEQGTPIALPPTQIIKKQEVFDYRAKYLPGITRKVTPIDLPLPFIARIREECEKLFAALQCHVYARIDGFFADDGKIYLNDPNTTSGMLPSSFFFHQAAEIGLNPSQFLTYIIYTSLVERTKNGKFMHHAKVLLHKLDYLMSDAEHAVHTRKKVAVIMGGYSTERHISVESGRNVYEKLSSSTEYSPTPIFLTLKDVNNTRDYSLFTLPTHILLKDNADDIREKVLNKQPLHPIIEQIRNQTNAIYRKFANQAKFESQEIDFEYLKNHFDAVFIALHGRPGEDGDIQQKLEAVGLPYNGSGVESSKITINKYDTNEILRKAGFGVAKHLLVTKNDYLQNPGAWVETIEKDFPYPFIAKPHDDGCSSAVKKIKNRDQLKAFAELMFRNRVDFPELPSRTLGLKPNEEFPLKEAFLIEELIGKNNAIHFLEITGGMLTRKNENGDTVYEVFEPSETLATGEVLSLEEKFLAGEGQNITPARFSANPELQKAISTKVKSVLQQVAKTLNVEGYCRIDAFVRVYEKPEDTQVIIIEINSLPGMTPATCIFHQCAINHYTPYAFIHQILNYGFQKAKNVTA